MDRGRYKGMAAAADDGKQVAATSNGDRRHENARRTQREAAFLGRLWYDRTLRRLTEDPAWDGGAQVDSYSHAFRPQLLDQRSSRDSVRRKTMIFFRHLSDGIKNPPGTMKAEQVEVCSAKFGGLCQLDPEAGKCQILAYNFHSTLRKIGVGKHELPVLVEISDSSHSRGIEKHLVIDMFGDGLLQIFLKVQSHLDRYTVEDLNSGGVVCTSHKVFKRVIQRVAVDMGIRTCDVAELGFIVHDIADGGEEHNGYCVMAKEKDLLKVALSTVCRIPRKADGKKAKVADDVGISFLPAEFLSTKAAKPTDPGELALDGGGLDCDFVYDDGKAGGDDLPESESNDGSGSSSSSSSDEVEKPKPVKPPCTYRT